MHTGNFCVQNSKQSVYFSFTCYVTHRFSFNHSYSPSSGSELEKHLSTSWNFLALFSCDFFVALLSLNSFSRSCKCHYHLTLLFWFMKIWKARTIDTVGLNYLATSCFSLHHITFPCVSPPGQLKLSLQKTVEAVIKKELKKKKKGRRKQS